MIQVILDESIDFQSWRLSQAVVKRITSMPEHVTSVVLRLSVNNSTSISEFAAECLIGFWNGHISDRFENFVEISRDYWKQNCVIAESLLPDLRFDISVVNAEDVPKIYRAVISPSTINDWRMISDFQSTIEFLFLSQLSFVVLNYKYSLKLPSNLTVNFRVSKLENQKGNDVHLGSLCQNIPEIIVENVQQEEERVQMADSCSKLDFDIFANEPFQAKFMPRDHATNTIHELYDFNRQYPFIGLVHPSYSVYYKEKSVYDISGCKNNYPLDDIDQFRPIIIQLCFSCEIPLGFIYLSDVVSGLISDGLVRLQEWKPNNNSSVQLASHEEEHAVEFMLNGTIDLTQFLSPSVVSSCLSSCLSQGIRRDKIWISWTISQRILKHIISSPHRGCVCVDLEFDSPLPDTTGNYFISISINDVSGYFKSSRRVFDCNLLSDECIEKRMITTLPFNTVIMHPDALVDKRNCELARSLYDVDQSPSSLHSGFRLTDSNPVSFGGYDELKKQLFELIQVPLVYELISDCPRLPAANVLLYGPPGCGKSLFAKFVAQSILSKFVSGVVVQDYVTIVRGPEILNKYVGKSEEGVVSLFQQSKSQAIEMKKRNGIFGLSFLIFDEFNSLVPRRSGLSSGITDRLVNQFLTCLDGLDTDQEEGSLRNVHTIFIGISSRPDLIDPAVLRSGRVSNLMFVGVPSPVVKSDGRNEILQVIECIARSMNYLCNSCMLVRIATHKALIGSTPADIVKLFSMFVSSDNALDIMLSFLNEQIEPLSFLLKHGDSSETKWMFYERVYLSFSLGKVRSLFGDDSFAASLTSSLKPAMIPDCLGDIMTGNAQPRTILL